MFKIQINNPKSIYQAIDYEISIEEAIENIFPLENDYAIMIWNNIFIPLTYKYDISCMILDFIRIVNYIDDSNEITLEIFWASNTFSSIWILRKEQNVIQISSQWTTVIGGVESLLNSNNLNIVQKDELKNEIVKLIHFLKNTLQINYNDVNKIEGFDLIN